MLRKKKRKFKHPACCNEETRPNTSAVLGEGVYVITTKQLWSAISQPRSTRNAFPGKKNGGVFTCKLTPGELFFITRSLGIRQSNCIWIFKTHWAPPSMIEEGQGATDAGERTVCTRGGCGFNSLRFEYEAKLWCTVFPSGFEPSEGVPCKSALQ